jgi:hypothetical protein
VRLRKLVERQRQARAATEGLAGLEDAARAAARAGLAEGQRADGKEAGGIAEELEGRQDEPAKKAAPKVRDGEREVFASAEALPRDRTDEARGAIDRGIAAFEEALALLSGKQDQQKDQDQDQDKDKDDQKKDDRKKDQKKDDSQYALTPREARAMQLKMDRERQDEEKKLGVERSSMAVDKDW